MRHWDQKYFRYLSVFLLAMSTMVTFQTSKTRNVFTNNLEFCSTEKSANM